MGVISFLEVFASGEQFKTVDPLSYSLFDRKGDFRDTIVVANPGTGKTTEIVDRVISLLQSGVKGEDIVCVTFTNKAADEMKTRIFKGIENHPEIMGEALKLEVSTIHGFVSNQLKSGGTTVKVASNTVLRYIVYNKLRELGTFNYGNEYLMGSIVPKMENGIRYLKSFGIMPRDIRVAEVSALMEARQTTRNPSQPSAKAVEVLVRDFKTIFQEYEDFKGKLSLMDFNDLLRVYLEAGNFIDKRYVLVDEFQDLNRMQVDIVSKLGKTRFFVGDRKQSIFGFQGGSLSSFHRYLSDSDFDIRGLDLNFRSTNNILDFAKSYLKKYSKDQQAVGEVEGLRNDQKGEGEPVQLIPSATPEADAVAKLLEVKQIHSGEKRSYAIIARTNTQLEKITSFLDESGIRYSSTVSGRSDRSQISDILSYISGLVSIEPRVLSRALMTPFSGYSLEESIKNSQSLSKGGEPDEHLPENMLRLRKMKFGPMLIDEAFEHVIFPIATSIGADYLSSARAVLDSAHDYLESFEEYSMDGFLDYMALASEPTENDLREEEVNLLTVHKAKGLAFHTVIYVPTETRNSLEYFDSMTYSIISTSTGVDVEQDLLEEPLRIDFVALTRAKDELFIIGNDRILSRYDTGCPCREVGSISTEVTASVSNRYNEPYMLFVNGRYEEAEKLLKAPKTWLPEKVRDYFSGVSRLSYSALEGLSDPYRFLRTRILGIRETSQASEAGEQFHRYAQTYLEGRIDRTELPQEQSAEFDNLDRAMAVLAENYTVPPKLTELKVEIPLSVLFPERGAPDNIMVEGRLDVIFITKDEPERFLVADYKTSRRPRSDYWHQLWLYTRMFQRYYGVKPEYLSGGIIYLSLREAIETGDKGMEVQVREYAKIKTDVVEKRISEFLMYMERPEAFVEKLLSRSPENELDSRLREALSGFF